MFQNKQSTSHDDETEKLTSSALSPSENVRLPEAIEATKRIDVRFYDYGKEYGRSSYYFFGDSKGVESATRSLFGNACVSYSKSDVTIDDLQECLLQENTLSLHVEVSLYDYNQFCGSYEFNVIGNEKDVTGYARRLRGNACTSHRITDNATGKPFSRS